MLIDLDRGVVRSSVAVAIAKVFAVAVTLKDIAAVMAAAILEVAIHARRAGMVVSVVSTVCSLLSLS